MLSLAKEEEASCNTVFAIGKGEREKDKQPSVLERGSTAWSESKTHRKREGFCTH
jgi:hypothetical protein